MTHASETGTKNQLHFKRPISGTYVMLIARAFIFIRAYLIYVRPLLGAPIKCEMRKCESANWTMYKMRI